MPMGLSAVGGEGPFPASLLEVYPITHQGVSAEMIAAKWSIPRDEIDEFSLRSHQLAAQGAGCRLLRPRDLRRLTSRWHEFQQG